METTTEVKPVKIDFKCPNCADGYLRPTGTCLPMNPPLFSHQCTHCGYGQTFNKTYPYIDYK